MTFFIVCLVIVILFFLTIEFLQFININTIECEFNEKIYCWKIFKDTYKKLIYSDILNFNRNVCNRASLHAIQP